MEAQNTVLKAKDFKKNTQFMYINSDSRLYTYFETGVSSEILFSNNLTSINGNTYNIKSITDKYLTMWDINFGIERTYRVKLSDLKIVNIQTNNLS